MRIKAFTDYPLQALGDRPLKKAPIREVTIIDYDGDKYCCIETYDGNQFDVKIGYVYKERGRCGSVESFRHDDLVPKFNHAYDFAFEVISNKEDASDVTSSMIRRACITRMANLPDREILEACDNYDTHEEGT